MAGFEFSIEGDAQSMHLKPKLHISRCISRRFRPLSSQRMPQSSQEQQLNFQQDVKAIDPSALATAMGGFDEPPEEPLLSTFEEGFGYFTTAAVGRSLKEFEFVRKVRWSVCFPVSSPF